MNFNMKSVNFL